MVAFYVICLLLLTQVNSVVPQTVANQTEPDYVKALKLSWLFYEAQQSGELPCWNRRGHWTEDGWKVSSHLDDGKDIGHDLTGGFYDAGDHLKVTLPLGFALSTLTWAALEFKTVYQAKGQYDVMRRNIRWGLDWLVKAHVKASDNADDNEIVAQVGDPGTDHKYWWKPQDEPEGFCRSVLLVNKKQPAADVAGSAAAALAAGAVLFADDTSYGPSLLTHATQLYNFGQKHKAVWKVRRGETIYNSTTYQDDLAWAAAWICRASTKDVDKWCSTAVKAWRTALPKHRYLINSDWENVFVQNTVMLLSMKKGTPEDMTEYKRVIANKMIQWQTTSKACTESALAFRGCYSPKGLLYMTTWGNMPRVANAALATIIYTNYMTTGSLKRNYRCWARSQLQLMLGGWGRSFFIGYGTNNPTHIHHRSASCPTDACTPCTSNPYSAGAFEAANAVNPNRLLGALIGGPDNADSYNDVVANYPQNEPALDYNAGITGALAGMAELNARIGSLTWTQYCNQEISFEADPLADTPKFTTEAILTDPLEVAVAAQCKNGTSGPAPTCAKSTRASAVDTQCTPVIQSSAGLMVGPRALMVVMSALVALLLAAWY